MEIRVMAGGGFASNLAYIEAIFGNAGDPYLYANDAGLDVRGMEIEIEWKCQCL